MPPLLADFTHARVCKPFCEKFLTLPDHADQDGRGAEGAEAETKNVGVEETDPRRPHFCVTGENSKSGAGSGFAYDEQD